MFIRLITGHERSDPRRLHGLFTELESLRKNDVLESYEAELAEALFDWFNDNLPCPPWEQSNWSSDAISWFKDSAREYISRMYSIVAILHEHGVSVTVLKAETLSYILYEDDYQVVAIDKRY